MVINSEARELNEVIESGAGVFWDFLSDNGKEIFFPRHGILGQSVASRSAAINATIGIGLRDDGEMLSLPSISSKVDMPQRSVFPYISSFGLAPLREAWKKEMLVKNPGLGDGSTISLPIITGGLTHALTVARYLFDDGKGELLAYNLFWTNYNLIFANGNNQSLALMETFVFDEDTQSYTFNLAALEKELSSRDKAMVLLNYPNNPSGYSLTRKEQDQLCDMLLSFANAGKKLLVICDDAYFGLFYEQTVAPESLFSRLANLHEHIAAVKVDGPTKEEFVWGLRVGAITFASKGMSPKALTALESKAAGVVRKTVSNVSTVSQHLVLSSLNDSNHASEKAANFEVLNARYTACRTWLDENKELYADYFTPLPFNSGYFLCLKLNDSFEAMKVREELLTKHSVAVIGLESHNLIRMAFSSVPTKDLATVFEKIVEVCAGFSS